MSKVILGGQPGTMLTDSGYEFVTWCGDGEAVFREKATGKDELWFAHKYADGYSLKYGNTNYEFARTLNDPEKRALAESKQNHSNAYYTARAVK